MDYVTPLFVLGMGRSGTTNALRVLNTHPDVMLNGEIALPLLHKFLDLLDATDHAFDKKDAMHDDWIARKAAYMYSSFGYLSKAGRGKLEKRGRAHFLGHKSPRLESLFDRYETHFAAAGAAPRYVYCARNAFDCWTSYNAMPWNSYESVREFLEDYAASYETLDRMQNSAPGRVVVLNLDALVASPDPLAFYRKTLFAPLGLELPERQAQLIAKIHSAKERVSKSRPLDPRDREAIETYPGLRARHDAMFAPYLKPASV